MKYNPTNHSIEYDDGSFFCQLAEKVSAKDAYGLADDIRCDGRGLISWEREVKELKTDLKETEEEYNSLEYKLWELKQDQEDFEFNYSRRKSEPNKKGWWWLYHEHKLHPFLVFTMNDEYMVQFANQTLPLEEFKKENPEYKIFYKAYEPE